MKKIITVISISLIACMSAYAQTIKLVKDGNVVASYSTDQVDAVIFEPEGQASVSDIARTYDVTLYVSLIEMPAMGIVATMPSTVTVTAASDGQINILFPACTYVMNGTPMTLPAVEVKDIAVTLADGTYSFSTSYSGVEAETSKAYSGTVKGIVSTSGAVDINTTMKYGSMPFTLSMQYTNAVAK